MKPAKQRAVKTQAFWLFFPAASLLAALAVPLSVWAVWSGSGFPPGLTGAGHGHEMIFGFALALVAGYTLGPQPRQALYPLFGLWVAARLSWTFFPGSAISQLLSPAFTLALAWFAVPRFSAAKKWRNRIVGPLILLLCLLAAVFWLSSAVPAGGAILPDRARLLQSGIIGLLLLMGFMGGRIIAPAAAGTLEKKGVTLKARVQPRIEGGLIVTLGTAIVLIALPAADALTGCLLLAAAGLIVARTLRWKLWRCLERPDLLVLGAGYLWLAAGALAVGAALLGGTSALPAMHLVTTGALGVLSASVMLRVAWQRSVRGYPRAGEIVPITLLLSGAAATRYLAGASPFSEPALLWASAALWSSAYLWVGGRLLLLAKHARTPRQ